MRHTHQILLVVTFCIPLLAQSTHFASMRPTSSRTAAYATQSASETPAPRRMQLVVNGAQAPDGIRDEVAIRFFVKSLVDPRRRQSVLAAIGITASDRAAVAAALGDTPAKLQTITAQRQQLSVNAPPPDEEARRTLQSQVATLKLQGNQLIDSTYARILNAVSGSGAIGISGYVRADVKRRVKGYSMPSMHSH